MQVEAGRELRLRAGPQAPPKAECRSVIGFLVLGVDYFEGDSCAHHQGEPGWDVDVWVVPFRTSAAKITPPWIQAVRERYSESDTLFGLRHD